MKSFPTIVFVLICSSVIAQQKEQEKYPLSKLIVKWSPLHLLDFYTTFQIALEQRIGKNISLQYDLGPVISTNVENGKYSGQSGYKAKLQLRFYIKPRAKHWAFYYGPEIYYNHIDYNKSQTYLVHPDNYYQFITYGMQYREQGVDVKFGTLFQAKRFCLDFQMGITGRFVNYTSVNEPRLPDYTVTGLSGIDILFKPSLAPSEKDFNGLFPTMGIRLGYILRK